MRQLWFHRSGQSDCCKIWSSALISVALQSIAVFELALPQMRICRPTCKSDCLYTTEGNGLNEVCLNPGTLHSLRLT